MADQARHGDLNYIQFERLWQGALRLYEWPCLHRDEAEFEEFVYSGLLKTRREKEHDDSCRERFSEVFRTGCLLKSSEMLLITKARVRKAEAIRGKTSTKHWDNAILGPQQYAYGVPNDCDIHTRRAYVHPELDKVEPPRP